MKKLKWITRTQETEVRAVELPEDQDNVYIEGYAAVFNVPSLQIYDERFGVFEETILPGAFDRTDMSDVKATDNHGKPFARTRNKTLELGIDEKGLYYRAKLSKANTRHMDLYDEVRSGLYTGSSFEFIARKGGYTFDRDTRKRVITDLEVVRDVSPVYDPAYIQATAEARSAFDVEIEEVQKAVESAELRKKLILKTLT